jgi:hypothetical protein
MATVAEAVAIIVNTTKIPESHVKAISRYLIKSGVLPKSSGRDIKKINFEQLTMLLLACIVSKSGESATDDMLTYYHINHIDGSTGEGRSAGNILSDVIASYINSKYHRFSDVMICLTDKVFEFKSREFNTPVIRLGSYDPDTRIRTYSEIPSGIFANIATAWREHEKAEIAS